MSPRCMSRCSARLFFWQWGQLRLRIACILLIHLNDRIGGDLVVVGLGRHRRSYGKRVLRWRLQSKGLRFSFPLQCNLWTRKLSPGSHRRRGERRSSSALSGERRGRCRAGPATGGVPFVRYLQEHGSEFFFARRLLSACDSRRRNTLVLVGRFT